VIRVYVPLKRDEEKARRAWDQFGAKIDRMLRETGKSEDELADLLDLRKPFPVKRDEDAKRRALDRLGETVNRVLQETGMTEDELADLFDLSKPLPE
jgi:hypothetical protein